MKLLVTFLLLAELALPQAVAPPSQPIPVDQENSRKAKTILDAAIQALGGQAYLNIHDITQEGRTFSFHHGQPNSFGVRFPGASEPVPRPVQTWKFVRTFGSVISIGAWRPAPVIVILTVSPFANTRAGITSTRKVTKAAIVRRIPCLLRVALN